MISKSFSSNVKYIRTNLRQNLWLSSIFGIVLFFLLPVAVMLIVSSQTEIPLTDEILKNIQTQLTRFFQVNKNPVSGLVLISAVVAALTSFFYLNSKKRVDLYHCLPMKREKLFVLHYISGFLNFLIPLFISTLLTVLVLCCTGLLAQIPMALVVRWFFKTLFFFLVLYSISVFVCMLCGNLFIAFLGICVFYGILPLLYVMYQFYMDYFFETYYSVGVFSGNQDIYLWLSPVDGLFRQSFGTSWLHYMFYALLAVLFSVGALILYRIRPSEGAGKAIAFPVAKQLIKYPIVFTCTLLGGIVFSVMSYTYNQLGWMIFGLVCGGFLCSCVMEVVLNFDFKVALQHYKGFAVYAVAFTMVFTLCSFDVFGYDRYLPKGQNLKTAALYVSGFQTYNELSDFSSSDASTDEWAHGKFDDPALINEALKLTQAGVKYLNEGISNSDRLVRVRYQSKLGITATRSYRIPDEEVLPVLAEIYNNEHYKKATNPLFYEDLSKYTILPASVNNYQYVNEYDNTGIYSDELVQAIKEETLAQQFDSFCFELPVRILVFTMTGSQVNGNYKNFYVPVYPSFIKTLALLEKNGIKDIQMPNAEDILSIEIRKNQQSVQIETTDQKSTTLALESLSRIVTDKVLIEEIMSCAVWEQGSTFNPFYEFSDYQITVTYTDNYEEDMYDKYGRLYLFPKGEVPASVEKLYQGQ